MIIFWTLAAGLMGLAMFFIALPLLRGPATAAAPGQGELNLMVFRRRLAELDGDLAAGVLDQDQFAAACKDLERELLSDLKAADPNGVATNGPGHTAAPAPSAPTPATGRAPWLTLLLIIAVPTAAVLAYLQLGDPGIIANLEFASTGKTQGHTAGPDGQPVPALDTLVTGLAERLAQDPNNLDGWLMLGRTYFAMEQPAKALEAIERAYQLAPQDAGVMVAYAQALAVNSGNRLDGRPADLIRAAVERDPGNPSVRWLNGMLAYQQGRFNEAVATWQAILDGLDPAGEDAQELRQMIAEARGRGVVEEPPAASSPAADAGAAATPGAGPRIEVSVTLAPALAAQASPTDTVFVFARAAAGPPMPLAVARVTVADLPASVTLDDSMAVAPTMRLSTFPQVIVGARVSKSGQATPSPGDLEGQAGPLDAAGTPAVAVTLDRVRP
jgi:cytochrome c-type biogenesis protein CcmH